MVTFILPSQHAKCDMMQLKENKGFSFVRFKSKAKHFKNSARTYVSIAPTFYNFHLLQSRQLRVL